MQSIFKILIMEIMTIFPLLFFSSICECLKIVNQKMDDIYFDLCLMASNFLLIETLGILEKPNYIIISIIPCLVALLKKRFKVFFVTLVILLIYFKNSATFGNFFVASFLLTLIFLIILYLKNKISKRDFLNIFCIATLILFIINGLVIKIQCKKEFFEYIEYMAIFYISIKVGCTLYIGVDHAYNIRKCLLEFEHEKELKNSLFKITHEIKNPIAVVKGYLDMFDPHDIDKSKKYISIIKSEINRTLSLLTDFLLFTKVNIEKEVINFTELIIEAKELVLPLIKEKKLFYSFEVEEKLFVSLDKNRVKQVILNLLKNAIEATNYKGTISLKAYSMGNKLHISITDNGCGMSKEILDSIKEPFYTTKQNGTGLGVCLSKEIIEAHGGTLNYTSSLNKGTTVKIIIPS